MFIFNTCLIQGIFPDKLKIAKVIPIYKNKGDRDSPSNYRPISLLPVMSKIFERLLHSQLYAYFEDHFLFNHSQYGFRKNRSTEMATLEAKEYILRQMEENIYTCGLFCDLTKAFDTIDHKILIEKLKDYGVISTSLKLLENYLANRHQCVTIHNSNSDLLEISRGVPQGSILGPLLFLAYVNDFVNIDQSLKCVLFADDSNVFLSDKSLSNLTVRLQDFLDRLSRWCSANVLFLNPNKTVFVLFRAKNKRQNINIDVYYEGCKINQTQEIKFLGVWFDEQLTWQKHIETLATKLRKVCGLIGRYRYIFPFKVKKIIYYSLFLSNVQYCCLVYTTATSTHLKSIYNLQKRFIRIMFNLDAYSSTSDYFDRHRFVSIFNISAHKIMQIFSQNRMLHYRNFLCSLGCLENYTQVYNTRIVPHFIIPRPKREFSKQKICFVLPTILNNCYM